MTNARPLGPVQIADAACAHIKETCASVDVVIVIVATRGRRGRVYTRWMESNPSSVRGVMDTAYEQEFGELPEAAEAEDDGDE